MKIIMVEEELSDIRIDKYLMNKLKISRSKIQKLIENNNILVNDNTIKNSYIVRIDDEIKINDIINENIELKAEKMDLDICYEDDDLVVINKQSGVVVHPAPGNPSNTLVNGLLYYCGNLSNNGFRPGIVHRIDKDTSGLLMVAKNDDTHIKLSEMFCQKHVTRKYVALVHGVIKHERGTIDAPIGRDVNNRKKMAVTDINSKSAITHFMVLERFNNSTLIECTLETGRTHQIRVHMNYINHPIVNDPIYGYNKTINNYGQMLHAKVLGFNHPRTNEYMEFEAKLPDGFVNILNLFKDS